MGHMVVPSTHLLGLNQSHSLSRHFSNAYMPNSVLGPGDSTNKLSFLPYETFNVSGKADRKENPIVKNLSSMIDICLQFLMGQEPRDS